DDEQTLGGERCNTGAHMDSHKQSACRPGHCKPNALEHMGKFSHAGPHRRNPRTAAFRLGLFPAVWKMGHQPPSSAAVIARRRDRVQPSLLLRSAMLE